MVFGIDASNLRRGGGITHLVELLRVVRPETHGVSKVVVWGGEKILTALEDHPWLEKVCPAELDRGLLIRALWQRFKLTRAAETAGCSLLFVPGGTYSGAFRPVVTMSRNLLPFEWRELRRYGWSPTALRKVLLRWTQSRTFRGADGVIFLTEYAKRCVLEVTGPIAAHTTVIPHGLSQRFLMQPRVQRPISDYCASNPYRILYVSIVDQYKHQWHVVNAVAELRQQGLPLVLDLVGPAYPAALTRLNRTVALADPAGEWVRYHGPVPYADLHQKYAEAHLGVFASSCENMPNILVETMGAGLPVACSNLGPMPEVLGDAGVYFDPEQPSEIARALRELIDSPSLRTEKAKACHSIALRHSWTQCAESTFTFLAAMTNGYRAERDSEQKQRNTLAHVGDDGPIVDYTRAPFGLKVRKALRYVRLYGISRTLIKIRAAYHMKEGADFDGPRWKNPRCRDAAASSRNVAIIGCGNYAFSVIAYYLAKREPLFLRATYDIDRRRARSLCQAYRGGYAAADWQQIVDDPQVRIVYIASNHASHADYAVACIKAGKDVHIEKPHAVTSEQLDGLLAAMKVHGDAKVFLGFNRRRSPLFKQLQESLSREPGSLMINWFIVGHEIPDGHWYLDDKEGGRILGNLCHWTDLTLHLVSMEKAFPCTIVPATHAGEKSDVVVSLMFSDRSCASINFCGKGSTFEGVREVLNVHKGNVLAHLTDFHTLTLEVLEKRKTTRLRHRDHGHELNVVHSQDGVAEGGVPGEDILYVAATARFVLAIREAVDSGKTVKVSWGDLTAGADDSESSECVGVGEIPRL